MTDDAKTAAAFFKAVPEILARYSAVVEANPGVYCDIKQLPFSKPVLKAALKVGWELARTDEQRKWIETGWHLLSTFQTGVGSKPLGGKEPPGPDLERFMRIAKMAEAEAQKDDVELSEYTRRSRSGQ